MGAWLERNRRLIGVLLCVYGVLGFGLVAASGLTAAGFARNADDITNALVRQRDAISLAIDRGSAAIESGADTINALGGTLSGSTSILTRASQLLDEAALAGSALADGLAGLSVIGFQPLAGVADRFRTLSTTAVATSEDLKAATDSLSTTAAKLPQLSTNLHQTAAAMGGINEELAALPIGPRLEDQLRMVALMLAVAAGWFLVQALLALAFGVALLRDGGRRRGEASGAAA